MKKILIAWLMLGFVLTTTVWVWLNIVILGTEGIITIISALYIYEIIIRKLVRSFKNAA